MEAEDNELMTGLFHALFPTAAPSPFLAIVGYCFAGALGLTIVIVISIRALWRSGKGMYDL
jgi:hypothetical protein